MILEVSHRFQSNRDPIIVEDLWRTQVCSIRLVLEKAIFSKCRDRDDHGSVNEMELNSPGLPLTLPGTSTVAALSMRLVRDEKIEDERQIHAERIT